MPRRISFATLALFAASTQGACVASSTPSACNVEGAKHFSPTATEREICEQFTRDFYAALGEDSAADIYTIALHVSPEMTITAQIAESGAASHRTFPQVAVDVMDRNLNYRDLTQLAEAAAKVVRTDETSD